jgi:hypothetical protein
MRYQDRPLFYYSPDEPTGGDQTFADPGGWDMSDLNGADLGEAAPSTGAMPVETPAEPSAAEAAAPEAPAEPEKPAEPEASVSAEKPADAEPAAKPEEKPTDAAPVATQAQLDALQAACDALGITETDPAKQAEAIVARRTELQAAKEQEAQAKEAERQKAAEENWEKQAATATHDRVMSRLKDLGWATDVVPPKGLTIWDDATWADTDTPDYGRQMAAAYQSEARSPEIAAFHRATFESAQRGYETTQAQIKETLAKYPHHDPTVAALMRDNGVDIKIIDTVARSTHEHTQRLIATTNSALTAAQARVSSLEAQVSGHAAELAKAREEARAEGQKAALAELEAARNLPNTTGLGGTSTVPLGVKGIFDDPGGWNLKDMEKQLANHR